MDTILKVLYEYRHLVVLVWSISTFIIEAVSLLVYFILFLFRNKSNPYVEEFILEKLPGLINTAEALYDDGSIKKDYVIDAMKKLINQYFPKVCSSIFNGFISKAIENLLSTPQKKEVKK